MFGVDFEHKSAEGVFFRAYLALLGHHRARRGRYLHEAVKQLLDSESVECRTEEHGSDAAVQVRLFVEIGVHAFYQLQVLAQLGASVSPISSSTCGEFTSSISTRSEMVCFEGVNRSRPCS